MFIFLKPTEKYGFFGTQQPIFVLNFFHSLLSNFFDFYEHKWICTSCYKKYQKSYLVNMP